MTADAPKPEAIPCPFVYASGRRCTGHVYRARAYGPSREHVRKYRLWCSEKDDHAGAVSDPVSKSRMEFYPDELAPGVVEMLWSGGMLDPREHPTPDPAPRQDFGHLRVR